MYFACFNWPMEDRAKNKASDPGDEIIRVLIEFFLSLSPSRALMLSWSLTLLRSSLETQLCLWQYQAHSKFRSASIVIWLKSCQYDVKYPNTLSVIIIRLKYYRYCMKHQTLYQSLLYGWNTPDMMLNTKQSIIWYLLCCLCLKPKLHV